jgi:hypothetical protein
MLSENKIKQNKKTQQLLGRWRLEGLCFEASQRKKLVRPPHLTKTNQAWWPIIPATQETKVGDCGPWLAPDKLKTLYKKKTKT